MRQRIPDTMIEQLIVGRGTTDGVTTPSALGAERLALDVQEARATLDEVHGRLVTIREQLQRGEPDDDYAIMVALGEIAELITLTHRSTTGAP